MSQEVVLVRHAETEWALAGKHTGRADIPLTDEGRETARRLAPSLAERSFAAVLVSPLSRAVDTAELAGLTDFTREPDLMEWDYGSYEGRRAVDIREERPGWLLWRDGTPDGEQPGDVAARVHRVISKVEGIDGDVALVAHGHVLRMLAVRWLEQPVELGARMPLKPGALGVLGWERQLRAMRGWSLTACPARATP